MSSFIRRKKNPKTGKLVDAFCIDDFYGPHLYGIGFLKNGKDATWDDDVKDAEFYRTEDVE